MTRDLLIAELTRDEGLKLFVYDDASGKPLTRLSTVVGHPTIGIGRALDVHGISEAEARYLLSNDVDTVAAALTKAYPWFGSLDDVRQRVLANMAFNLGSGGLANFHATLENVGQKRFEVAARSMETSLWYRQVGPRAVRLAGMMRTGVAA
jgi:lysozyme